MKRLKRLEFLLILPLLIGCEGSNTRVVNRVSKTIIASEGGTIVVTGAESVFSSGFEISIPPDALSKDTTITIGDVTPIDIDIPEGEIPIGLPISLEPKGLTFLKPVTMKFPYSDEKLLDAGISSLDHISIKLFNEQSNTWKEIPLKEIDEDNLQIVIETQHLSWWNPFSWFENPTEENLINQEDVIDYITNTLKIGATVGEIGAIIDPENILIDDYATPVSYFEAVRGILVAKKMLDEVENGNSLEAIRIGEKYLIRKLPVMLLKAAGFTFLGTGVSVVIKAYDLAIWICEEVNEALVNMHIASYVNLKRCDLLLDEMFNSETGWLYVTMWKNCRKGPGTLNAPVTCNDCEGLECKICLNITPEDVYTRAEAIYQLIEAQEYLAQDEANLKEAIEKKLGEIRGNKGPEAAFYVTPAIAGEIPFTVTVDASPSRSETSFDIIDYNWNFGDGDSASGKIAEHTYTRPGNYTLVLEVKDSDDRIGKTSKIITKAKRFLAQKKALRVKKL